MTISKDGLFRYASLAPCEQLRKPCLERQDLLNMGGCLTNDPPEGVTQDTYKQYCAKLATCGLFDVPGCEPEASELATEIFGAPVPCLTKEQHAFFDYCDQYGHMGPNLDLNQLCWAAMVSPNRTAEQLRAPDCADADCLTIEDIGAIGACLSSRSCPNGPQWLDAMMGKPVCTHDLTTGRRVTQAQMARAGCLTDTAFDQVVYCLTEGSDGPDPDGNAACFSMTALQLLDELASIKRCSGQQLTPRQQLEIQRRISASAEQPTTVAPTAAPSAEQPTTVAPTAAPSAEAPMTLPESAPSESFTPETGPRTADSGGVSKAWMIGGAVGLVALVGAGVYFSRKR